MYTLSVYYYSVILNVHSGVYYPVVIPIVIIRQIVQKIQSMVVMMLMITMMQIMHIMIIDDDCLRG